MALRKRVVLLVLLGIFGAFAGISPASAVFSPLPVLVGSTSPCKNVVWVGAQGSGQTFADWQGLGAQVREGLDAYASHMDGYTVGFFPVPYPAMGVPDVDVFLFSGAARKAYFDSIDSGVRETLTFLGSRYAICPNEHYVLAGYSQGAMVMHRTLNQLLSPTKKQAAMAGSVLPRLDGVLAIADGDRVADQGGSSYGTARTDGYGVTWAPLANGVRYTYPPMMGSIPSSTTWPATRFHSVCDAGDTVCDFNHAFNVTEGIRVHSYDYAPGGDGVVFVQSAATNISKTTKTSLPLLKVQGGALPDATPGSPYRQDLNASLLSGTTPLSWSLIAPLWSGWAISPTGVLTGTPSEAGRVTLDVSVTDSNGMSATTAFTINVGGTADTTLTVGRLRLTYPSSKWTDAAYGMGPSDSFAYDTTNDAPCVGCDPAEMRHAYLQTFIYDLPADLTHEQAFDSWAVVGPAPSLTVGGIAPTWSARLHEAGLPPDQTLLAWCFQNEGVCLWYRRPWTEQVVEPSQALIEVLQAGDWVS